MLAPGERWTEGMDMKDARTRVVPRRGEQGITTAEYAVGTVAAVAVVVVVGAVVVVVVGAGAAVVVGAGAAVVVVGTGTMWVPDVITR